MADKERIEPPNPETTGQILQFRVINTLKSQDRSLPPLSLPLSAFADLRQLVTPEMVKSPRRSYIYVVSGANGPIMLTFNGAR